MLPRSPGKRRTRSAQKAATHTKLLVTQKCRLSWKSDAVNFKTRLFVRSHLVFEMDAFVGSTDRAVCCQCDHSVHRCCSG